MGLPRLKPSISVTEYLEGEKTAAERHEFVDGELYAMSGASKRHNRIVRELLDRFDEKIAGTECEVFFTDVKLRIEHLNRFYYPDLVVVCGDDSEDDYYVSKPTIIVEVLSPSTALTDKREKWFAYQEISSLREYAMIDQESGSTVVYRRRDDGLWEYVEFTSGENITFESIDLEFALKSTTRED